MRKKGTRNPLRKRYLREIKSQWKKYLALFLLLTLTIGFVSGMFVANDSMETAAQEAYEKYNIEDGHFTMKELPADALLATFAEEGIHLVKQFYKDFDEDDDLDGERDAKARVFAMRDEMNRACLMEGRFPEKDDEIVIDRMHADNSNVTVGDTIRLNGRDMTIVGLVAFSDYSTLYENSSDVMFDALTFDVAAVTPECYETLDGKEAYQYAFQYNERPQSETEQKEKAETLAEQLMILSASGGLIDDEETADKLEELIDAGEALEEEGDTLEAEGDALEAEGDTLEMRGDALQEKADALKQEGAALEKAAMSLEITPDVAMQKKAELEKRGEELQKEGDALEAEADDLKKRGDDLQARADDLQKRADALEAELTALLPQVKSFEDLEQYEDETNELKDFVPEYANQAIHFAPSDLGSDKVMCEVLLIILIIVLAFIFAITVNQNIEKEAAVIGTLRASGYKRSELLIHYVSIPVIITFVAAVVGNLLGYSCFKGVVVSMYYNSYSLPTYVTLWNADGFIRTTVYPLLIMAAICTLVVFLKLRLSPLRFLRRDLRLSRRKKAVRLPKWKLMTRFRLRILFQNIPDYLVLTVGIFFVMIMLAFSVGLPATLDAYKADITDYMIADYQVILKSAEDKDGNPVETSEPTAEKFDMEGLVSVDGPHIGEKISAYGYQKGSSFFDLPDEMKDGEVYVSDAYSEKFHLSPGDSVTLKEELGGRRYDFTIIGIYDLPGTVAILMPQDVFDRVFERKEGEFTGFLSKNEIMDIDDEMIMTVITEEDMMKMAKQLDHSMGSYMKYFAVICMLVAMLLIYLLTKLIIEKNAVSISMVKVLGYTNREINSLYIRLTTCVVILGAVITSCLSFLTVREVWKMVMYRLNGWFTFAVRMDLIIETTVMVIISYLIVSFFDMRRIKKIPLTEALKNVE